MAWRVRGWLLLDSHLEAVSDKGKEGDELVSVCRMPSLGPKAESLVFDMEARRAAIKGNLLPVRVQGGVFDMGNLSFRHGFGVLFHGGWGYWRVTGGLLVFPHSPNQKGEGKRDANNGE
jgi:hypothetical protein